MWTKDYPTTMGHYWMMAPGKKRPFLVLLQGDEGNVGVKVGVDSSVYGLLTTSIAHVQGVLWHPVVPPELPESDDE